MADTFSEYAVGLGEPYVNGFAVTPHDTNELAAVTRAVWVGGAGALKVTLLGGDTVTLAAVPAGTLLKIRATVIFSTGTTATVIVGLY